VTRSRSLRRAVGDLTDAGLIARNCGRRMWESGEFEWVAIANEQVNLRPWLSADEARAWDTLLPGTFWAQWWHGWNDAAAEKPND
jgi:hypothetical protein